MPEPRPSSPNPPDSGGTSGEEARIEQLLVTGLDHYFSGEFDAAIHVWTRVLFLDRHHDRARAYIERARSAQAERQRQGDALLHEGFDAFDRGDVEQARQLMGQALALGASHDAALGVLGRIERLDVGGTVADDDTLLARRSGIRRAFVPPSGSGTHQVSPLRFWILTACATTLLIGAGWWAWTTSAWQDVWPSPADQAQMSAIPETLGPSPVPTASEAYFRRGQALFERGRLREALTILDRVPAGDAMRAEADRMRARIQRELLALALIPISTSAISTSPAPTSPLLLSPATAGPPSS